MNTKNQSIVPVSVEDLSQNVFNPDYIVQADSWESFVSLWTVCEEVEQAVQWYKGDVANKVATIHGEGSLEKFAHDVNVPYRTMIAYRRTSRAFDLDKRLSKLSWSHYFIASEVDSWDKYKQEFTTSERFQWVEKADDENWSAGRFRKEIAEYKAKENGDTLFQYYANAIKVFGAIVKKWDINQLRTEQKEELAKLLDILISDFKTLLLKEQSTANVPTPNT